MSRAPAGCSATHALRAARSAAHTGIKMRLRRAYRSVLLRSSLGTAAVVGTVLNVFNESPALWHHQPLSWLRILLNLAVPFLVASYSAVAPLPSCAIDTVRRRGHRRKQAEKDLVPR